VKVEALAFDLLTALVDSWSLWIDAAADDLRGRAWRRASLRLGTAAGGYRPYEGLVAAARRAFPDARVEPILLSGEARETCESIARALDIEHVRSDSARLARWQDRLHGLWYYVNDGCNCNRDTLATIEASPLRVGEVEHDQLPEMLLARPILIGAAAKPSPG